MTEMSYSTFIQDAVDHLNRSGFKQFSDVKRDEEFVGKTAVSHKPNKTAVFSKKDSV